jgi:hypothetical protein
VSQPYLQRTTASRQCPQWVESGPKLVASTELHERRCAMLQCSMLPGRATSPAINPAFVSTSCRSPRSKVHALPVAIGLGLFFARKLTIHA